LSELLDAVPVGAVIGVNFLTPSREDFPAVQEAAARMPYVECFWAEPDPELVRIIHAGGALAGWQVGSAREAREAENAGGALAGWQVGSAREAREAETRAAI
jgi:nitronate monooxygenase